MPHAVPVRPAVPPHRPQLPVLRGLQRVIDELAFGVHSCQPVATPTRLIMEQVGRWDAFPVAAAAAAATRLPQPSAACRLPPAAQMPMIRACLLRRGDWAELARRQAGAQFGAAAQRVSQQRLQAMLRSFELMCGMEEAEEQAAGRQEVSGHGCPSVAFGPAAAAPAGALP